MKHVFYMWVSLLVLSMAELKRLITTLLDYTHVSSKQNLRLMRPLKLKVRKFDWQIIASVIHHALWGILCSSPIIILFLLVLPHVVAYKHSENANEKDKAVLICVSHGYPLPTDWSWYKLSEDESKKVIDACCKNIRLVPCDLKVG